MLAALDDPAAVIDPFLFAQWSARPEIAAALAARDLLRHNTARLRAEAQRDEALEDARYARAALRQVIDTARALLPSTPPTQDSGPRTQDPPARTQHALSELRRAATSLGRLAAISRALVDRPAVAVRALAAITTRVHARAADSPRAQAPPRRAPSPDLTPAMLATMAVTALASPTPDSLAELQAFITKPDNACPPPDLPRTARIYDFARAPATALAITNHYHNRKYAGFHARIARGNDPPAGFSIITRYMESGPRAGCWLISHLRADADPYPSVPHDSG